MSMVLVMSERENRHYPRRLVVDVDEETYRHLKAATFDDEISNSHRLRALIDLYRNDEGFRQKADKIAAELREEDRQRRYQKDTA